MTPSSSRPSMEGDATLAERDVEDKIETGSASEKADAKEGRQEEAEAVGHDLERPPAAPEARPDDFVEGGVWGWCAVFAGFLILVATFGSSNGYGAYQSYYELNQFSNESSSNIAWIGSIQLFLVFAGGPFAGRLFDKGYCRHVLLVGGILQVIGVFLTSICTKYWQALLAQALLTGIGMGMQFLPAVSLLSHYFRRRRSLAMGLATAGSSVGGVVFPILLNRLFASIGFRKGVQASGYLILGCLVVANLLVRPRPPPKPATAASPVRLRTIFSSPKYVLLCAGGFCVAWGIFFAIVYLQVFAERNNVSASLVPYLISILNAASIVGRVLPNFVSDRLGPFNMLIPCCTASAILVFAMFGARSDGASIVFAILYGFTSGAYVSIIGPAIASLSTSIGEIGIRLGLAFSIIGLAGLTGTPISGALLSAADGRFYAPIIFSGISILCGSCFFLASRRLQARDRQTWKV